MTILKDLPGSASRFGILLFAGSLSISFVPAEFGIAIAFAGWLAEGMINRNWQIRPSWIFISLAVYVVWNIMSALASARPLHSVLAVGDNEWPAMIMIMMFWIVRSEQLLRKTVVLFVGVSSVAMIYAVWQTFGGVEFYRNMDLTPVGPFYRNVGFYSFYLTFAGMALTVFCIAASLSLLSKGREKVIFLTIAVFSLAAIVGSFARSIWLALLVVTPLLGFVGGKKRGLITVAGIFALVTVLMVSVPALRERAISIVDLEKNQTRLNLWKTSIALARDYPILGVGEDNFDFHFPAYRVEGYYDTATHPHNDYLNVLVSSGIPGLLAFLAMWGMALWTGFRTFTNSGSSLIRAVSLGASLGLTGYLIGGFFQNYYGTFANCLGWWFMVGLIYASAGCSEDQLSERARVSES